MSPALGRKEAYTFEGYVAPRCPNHGRVMREMRQCVWRCDVTKCGVVLDAKAADRGWKPERWTE